jgi:gliding motility-associated-like protein
MRKYILPILTALALPFAGNAQVCNVSVAPSDTIICPGDSVLVTSSASITSSGQQFDFDFGVIPPGWSTSGGATFSQPCGAGINNTPYYWASTSGGGTPQINSPAFDVSCGGVINFDMVYAVQGGSSPCEGPDLAHEGVELQYSTDGGVTWTTIVYYSPGGFELPAIPGSTGSVASGATPYTTWNSFSVPLPPGAQTTGTQFQWIQQNSSGTCCDNWGVDNIIIAAGPCNSATVDWNGDAVADSNNFYFTPTQDTFFVADVYDSLGNYACTSDTVFIQLYQNTMTYDLVDTVFSFCPFDSIPESVVNVQNAPGPYTYDWSTGDNTPNTILGGGPNQQDEIWFYVDVTDGCGFVRTDSVVMIVNQTLAIDTTLAFNANACTPTGAASAIVSGVTSNGGQPFYNWTGPGNPGPNSVDGTVIDNVPSGWYYFTVIDDVCEATDSVFIGIDEPPIAAFSPASAAGCAPVEVSFVNESENTINYVWDFGDGSPQETTTDASHSFGQTSTVMMIASDASGCADTAYAQIDVVPCGCTDPQAINYNPLAIQDDGSCIYPIPEVDAPNVFTPDGDNTNDLFFLDTKFTESITLVITNRWGNVMYEGTGPNPAWDGKNQSGQDAEEGVYFYKYTAVGVIEDSEVEGHGFVHLERP